MNDIEAKTILQHVTHPSKHWFISDYNMNLYKGCSHGCIYCDSRSENYQIEDFSCIRSKQNAIQILENELKRKRNKGIIGMGAMSDPYNPVEHRREITRKALELILKYGYGVSIVTKSTLVLRDLDLLTEIAKNHVCHVAITITTIEDDLCKIIEPNVSVSSERFQTIKVLKEAGVTAGILMMPVLPFINDTKENIQGMIQKAQECKADYIYPFFGVTLRNIQRDYFYQKLDEHFPLLKQKYKNTYQNTYICTSPNHIQLYELFNQLIQKTNMVSEMKDINQLLRKKETIQQISFDL